MKTYLKLLHTGFHVLYSVGGLRRNRSYKCHYFNKLIIRKGDYILDIGANLGYYTKLFARWAGITGHVYAVEPVACFADTIKWGLRHRQNITLYNYALGAEEKEATLATPGFFGYLRTGSPHITNGLAPGGQPEFVFSAKMKRGSELFASLPRLDFIKCDIEGYEAVVLPEIVELLLKYKPVLQVETWGDQQTRVEGFLEEIGYEPYDIENGLLKPVQAIRNREAGDLFFIHRDNNAVIGRLRTINKAV
ncbi:MAG: FkbM family methyltransferase [Chitinophagaceae bacterium]